MYTYVCICMYVYMYIDAYVCVYIDICIVIIPMSRLVIMPISALPWRAQLVNYLMYFNIIVPLVVYVCWFVERRC